MPNDRWPVGYHTATVSVAVMPFDTSPVTVAYTRLHAAFGSAICDVAILFVTDGAAVRLRDTSK